MDDKELSHLVAEKLGGISREEVEAELKRAEAESKFGNPKGVAEFLTVVALIVQLARVAAQFWATTEQLLAALKAKAALAPKISEAKRDKIINLFVEEVPVEVTPVGEPCE